MQAGQLVEDERGRIRPDLAAFNLREDPEAAKVFPTNPKKGTSDVIMIKPIEGYCWKEGLFLSPLMYHHCPQYLS